MGIRFHCPNGHKLNVKSFLAGKKGVCPKCGTKVRIPTVSEPGLDEGSDSDVGKIGPQGGNGAAHVARPAAVPVGTAVAAGPVIVPQAGPVAAVLGGAAVAAPVAPAAMPAVSDPIAEAPTAVWYVRPPTGGQYGPARGDILRRWIAEGRVSSDSLVWREGWTDWRNAGQLFPGLNAAGGPAAAAVAAPATPALPAADRSARSTTRYRTKKSSGSGLAIAALVLLGILCVVLVGVLVYVLSNMQ